MSKNTDKSKADMSVEALMLECTKDRYKVPYAALRWAKELKQKENLADSIPVLVMRAMREVLTGKVSLKEIEKLPFIFRLPTPVAVAPVAPTITLKVAADEPEEPAKKSKGKEKSSEE